MIPVKVEQIVVMEAGFVVVLRGVSDSRSLPIVIGAPEAQAIAIHLSGVSLPRPMTHDLMRHLLNRLDGSLKSVEINALRKGTFFATLIIDVAGEERRLDSRPSDAVALALRCEADIAVDESVMDEAGCDVDEDDDGESGEPGDPIRAATVRKPKEVLSPEEALEKDLTRAVEEERYEDAAKLRDEIERLKNMHKHN